MFHVEKTMFHAMDGFFEEISDKLEKGNEAKFLKEDHIMKYRITSVLHALFMVLTLPTTALAATIEVNILSYPTKASYRIGEGFDTTGLNAVIKEGNVTKNINDKITFYTSKTVEMTQGRPFATTETKVVEIRYEGKIVNEYTVTVTDDSVSTPMPAPAANKMVPTTGLTLYKVMQRDPKSDASVISHDLWNNWNVPYRLSPGGEIQGEIPWGTVFEATASDGTWLKVKYGGRDCYVYQAKMSKVNEPDMVCSPWAKERLS